MSAEQWTAVEQWITGHFLPDDEVLHAALEMSEAGGLPPIQVSPNQGKLLQLLVQMIGARRVLEIGTLGGYSTIWMGRAIPPGGKLITLEADAHHAAVARGNLVRAGLASIVELQPGLAIESLAALEQAGVEPFDLVFIDADKPSTSDYFESALRLTKPGSLIVVDNVVRKGGVIDEASTDPNVQGVRRFYARAANEPRVSVTAIQTVGSKGYDGFAIARVC